MTLRLDTTRTLRLLIGLVQGVGLYAAVNIMRETPFAPSSAFFLSALFLIALYVPPVAMLSLGNMPTRKLLTWLGILALVLGALAVHDIQRRIGTIDPNPAPRRWDGDNSPSAILILSCAPMVFIAHTLMSAAHQDGRIIARYSRYFDAAWKQAVQLSFAAAFTAALWLVLFLGAALFNMLKMRVFEETITNPLFYWPITCMAVSTAIHLTDVAPGIIAGIRKLALMLLSWLLPLMVLIAIGFLATLAATSLDLLWQTRQGAATVLIAAATLIILANAAYQQGPPRDGVDGHIPAKALAWAGAAIGPLLLVLIGLAAYATHLRVDQYGWTADRVILAALVAIGALYAVGYSSAGLWGTLPRRRWEATNVAASFVIVAIMAALLSPVADPARIAVDNQINRLRSGLMGADKFDFVSLRFDGVRYGHEALQHLAAGPNSEIAAKAVAVQKAGNRYLAGQTPKIPITPEQVAANLTVHPRGKPLPAGLTKPDQLSMECFTTADKSCDVVLLGRDRSGAELVMVISGKTRPFAWLVRGDQGGKWQFVGSFSWLCPEQKAALLQGRVNLETALIPDVVVGGTRLPLGTNVPTRTCP